MYLRTNRTYLHDKKEDISKNEKEKDKSVVGMYLKNKTWCYDVLFKETDIKFLCSQYQPQIKP